MLACLGEMPEAEKTLRLSSQLAGTAPDEITVRTLPIHLRLGHRDNVLAFLARTLAARGNGWRVLHATARFDPGFDPLRGDPRFEKLLRDNLPEGAKPFADQKTTDQGPQTTSSSLLPSSPPDTKSVAVLAFANLSDDKSNEYFSDGISEELLNVLAKVPGLKVSARTSAFYFKGKEVPIPEIAKQLGVAYVVEGSVRKQRSCAVSQGASRPWPTSSRAACGSRAKRSASPRSSSRRPTVSTSGATPSPAT